MTRIYLSPPHMGAAERALLLDAYDSNWIAPLGPHVDAFEAELAARVGIGHAVALSSGTAALHLALELLGVRRGDDVLVPSLTFAASANPIAYVGANPVFIDSERTSWNLDPALLEEELADGARRGRLPRAVIIVDLYGQCADWDPIVAACERYGVPIIEDAAEALGATYRGRNAGTFGVMSVLSFNGNKIITTSGGGALLTERKDWAERARYLSTQARDPAPHYQHSVIGYNYRLSNLLAAVGRGQLSVLDARVAARRATAAAYAAAFADIGSIKLMPEASFGRSNRWLTCILLDDPAAPARIREHLATLDIEARPIWKPLHMQPVFADCRRRGGAVAEDIFAGGLCLPSGSSLTDADRARVIAGVRAAL